jgi:signal transduction histidine kinase
LIVRNNRQRRIANELLREKNNEIANQNMELKQANEIKDKLFFIIGHDMRGPLSSLKAMLGMVARNEISAEEFKFFAPQLSQHVVGVSETIENLLQWSGSQLHGWQQQPGEFPIRTAVEKAINLFKESAHRKQINLINEVDGDWRVHADQNQTELVFRNLIHNAIKFTPEGGQVSASATISGEFVIIEITDTGVGISEAKLASLFYEPGIRTTRGTKGEKGTGLGLTLCHEMIRANKGRINVTSTEGKGTTVQVYLRKADL